MKMKYIIILLAFFYSAYAQNIKNNNTVKVGNGSKLEQLMKEYIVCTKQDSIETEKYQNELTKIYEYEKKHGAYKVDIKQITPKDGIKTGHLIAYGHYIKPPYKIEVKDSILTVNNVQILPKLKPSIEIEKKALRKKKLGSEVKYDKLTDNTTAVFEEYLKLGKDTISARKISAEYYKDKLKVFNGKCIEITTVSKDGFRYIYYNDKGVRKEGSIRYMQDAPIGKENINLGLENKAGIPNFTAKSWAADRARSMEDHLKSGSVIIITENTESLLYLADLNKIKNIVKDGNINRQDKIQLLTEAMGDGAYIIDNFDEKEWESVR
jgi:hypothetical protein